MGVSERKQRQHEELRNQIIECSREIVEEEGWGNLSIRKIADAIEYSVPVIYKHFENKEAITAYFVQEGFQNLLNEVLAHIDPNASIEERFQQLGLGYYHFAEKFPKHYEVMFGLGIPTCESARNVESINQLSGIFSSMIKELSLKNPKKEIDQCLKYRTLWSLLHGVVAFELLALPGVNPVCSAKALEDVVDGYVKSILF